MSKKLLLIFGLLLTIVLAYAGIKVAGYYGYSVRLYNTKPTLNLNNIDDAEGSAGLISMSTMEPPDIAIGYWWGGKDTKNNITIDFTFYKINKDTLLEYFIHNDKNDRTPSKLSMSEMTFDGTYSVENVKRDREENITLPIEGTGIWYVVAKSQELERNFVIVRSDFAVISKEGNDEVIFWAQDLKTLKSKTNGTIKTYSLLDKKQQLDEGDLNEDGVARLPMKDNMDLAIAETDSGIAVIPLNMTEINTGYMNTVYHPKYNQYKIFTFIDRPIYKPGDTVYYKAIIRKDDNAAYSVSQDKIYVNVALGNSKIVTDKELTPNEYGGADYSFKIPENAKTGTYYMTTSNLKSDEINNYNYGKYFNYYKSFSVEEYRKPQAFVTATLDKKSYMRGEKIKMVVKASYFSGQPFSNGNVDYRITSNNLYLPYSIESIGKTGDYYGFAGYYYYGDEIKTGTTSLDKKGQAEILLDSKEFTNVGGTSSINLQVTLNSPEVELVENGASTILYGGEYEIFLKGQERYSYSLDNLDNGKIKTKIQLHAVLNKETIQGVTLSYKLENNVWEKDENGRYHENVSNVGEGKTKTDDQGIAEIEFEPKKHGRYNLIITGSDSAGNTISRTFYYYFYGKEYLGYYNSEQNIISLNTDKEVYKPGETAKVTIMSKNEETDAFVSLDLERVSRYYVVSLKNGVKNMEIPIEDSYMPNRFFTATTFSGGSVGESSQNISVSTDSKKLKVNVKPDKLKYAPGETAFVDIQTTNMEDEPVSGEVTLWVVDKALFELKGSNLGNIQNTFWQTREDNTTSTHSLQSITATNAERGGCFAEGTQISLPNNSSKAIEDLETGDVILSMDKNLKAVPRKVLNTHSTTVGGYLIINQTLKITPEHVVYLNDKWQEIGNAQIGDLLTKSNGEKEEILSIEWLAGKFKVYNLDVEENHNFIANGVLVHNEKGDPRTVFKDAVYWNPRVRTAGDGKARVSFKLPDNLTTWAVSAVGATKSTIVGQNIQDIVVSKDVVMQPVLPNIFRFGDTHKITSYTQNFSQKDLKFDVSLEFDSGEVRGEDKKGVYVPKEDFAQFEWIITPTKVTEESKIKASAISDNKELSDIMEVTIPTKSKSFSIEGRSKGTDNATYEFNLNDNIDLSLSEVVLDLSPSISSSMGRSLDYLIAYPYGCIEQTTSRFVPVLVAKQNPGLFGNKIKVTDLDKYITTGMERLEKLSQSDGGWNWYYSGNQTSFVTAYVLENVIEAKKLGYEMDKDIYNKAVDVLAKDNLQEGKILYTYIKTLEGEIQGIIPLETLRDREINVLALGVISNYMNGEKDSEKNGLKLLESKAIVSDTEAYWRSGPELYYGSETVSTAIALRALLIAEGNEDLINKSLEYLKGQMIGGYFGNTYSTAQVLKTVSLFTKKNSEQTPNFEYQVYINDNLIKGGRVTTYNQILDSIRVDLNKLEKGNIKIRVEKNGNGKLYTALNTKLFTADSSILPISNGVTIKKRIYNAMGPEYNITPGDLVNIDIEVSGLTRNYFYGVIEDELPAGLVPINERLKNAPTNSENYYWYGADKEYTLNGVIFNIGELRNMGVYTYRARAINEGSFQIPPSKFLLMYKPEINAVSEAGTLLVESERKVDNTKRMTPLPMSKILNNRTVESGVFDIVALTTLIGIASFLIIKKVIKIRKQKNANTQETPNS